MERELPPGIDGIAEKHLAWEEYQGKNSRIYKLAEKIYFLRLDYNIPGDDLSDWFEAREIIKQEFVEEEMKKRGLSLREASTSDIIPTYNMIVVFNTVDHDN